ncbi:hypothetical protein [Nguyenibacter vanlangensis]|uniref:Uncharacterized protein n=1 Tax=Nguyenibacter vanlangensis TaxID=1216886 RepID=A0A7Y7IUV6_9PROT|nr:hypothetical protein [Nguyenibacter vanlangensis]NVN10833.1 hypothetical protein [Nguyenibacter vanlangensis]
MAPRLSVPLGAALLASATPAMAAPPTASPTPAPVREHLVVIGNRTYTPAPVPDMSRPPPKDDDAGIPLGPLGKFRLGGTQDPDHDPVTGTWLAPFGTAYETSNPLSQRHQ